MVRNLKAGHMKYEEFMHSPVIPFAPAMDLFTQSVDGLDEGELFTLGEIASGVSGCLCCFMAQRNIRPLAAGGEELRLQCGEEVQLACEEAVEDPTLEQVKHLQSLAVVRMQNLNGRTKAGAAGVPANEDPEKVEGVIEVLTIATTIWGIISEIIRRRKNR